MTTGIEKQMSTDNDVVAELLAIQKLMEYADAWRTNPGCSCCQCALCEARELSPEDADAIAAILQNVVLRRNK